MCRETAPAGLSTAGLSTACSSECNRQRETDAAAGDAGYQSSLSFVHQTEVVNARRADGDSRVHREVGDGNNGADEKHKHSEPAQESRELVLLFARGRWR